MMDMSRTLPFVYVFFRVFVCLWEIVLRVRLCACMVCVRERVLGLRNKWAVGGLVPAYPCAHSFRQPNHFNMSVQVMLLSQRRWFKYSGFQAEGLGSVGG